MQIAKSHHFKTTCNQNRTKKFRMQTIRFWSSMKFERIELQFQFEYISNCLEVRKRGHCLLSNWLTIWCVALLLAVLLILLFGGHFDILFGRWLLIWLLLLLLLLLAVLCNILVLMLLMQRVHLNGKEENFIRQQSFNHKYCSAILSFFLYFLFFFGQISTRKFLCYKILAQAKCDKADILAYGQLRKGTGRGGGPRNR